MRQYYFKQLSVLVLCFTLTCLIYNAMEEYSFAGRDTLVMTTTLPLQERGIIGDDEYNILIDLTESVLYLFKGDEFVKKYIIAQGKPSSPSPIGVWRIANKARNWLPLDGTKCAMGHIWYTWNKQTRFHRFHGISRLFSNAQ